MIVAEVRQQRGCVSTGPESPTTLFVGWYSTSALGRTNATMRPAQLASQAGQNAAGVRKTVISHSHTVTSVPNRVTFPPPSGPEDRHPGGHGLAARQGETMLDAQRGSGGAALASWLVPFRACQ